MSAGMPELGSKISLISKADIRYEGRLFTVDPQECTIALASVVVGFSIVSKTEEVGGELYEQRQDSNTYLHEKTLNNLRSFGTENRETEFPVPAQSQVYDYILFRGSDIKDIRIVNNVTQPLNDPAIMQLSVPPSLSQQPFQTSHPVLGSMGAQQINQFAAPGYGMGPIGGYGASSSMGFSRNTTMSKSELITLQPQEPSPAAVLSPVVEPPRPNVTAEHHDLIGGGGTRSTTPTSFSSRKSPTTDQCTQAGSNKDKKMVKPIQPPSSGQKNQHNQQQRNKSRERRDSGRISDQGRRENQNRGPVGNRNQNHGYQGQSNQNAGGQRQGWTNRGPLRQRGRPRGGSGYRPNPSNKGKNTLKFDNEYDFEQANNEFEELRHQFSAKVKIEDGTKTATPTTTTTTTTEVNGDTDKKDDSGNETGAGENEVEEEHEVYYDKAKSFFDKISCEAVERAKGKSQRTDWRTERKLNSETFGVAATRRGNYRGRGGYRGGMGYRGGYRGGYRHPQHHQQQRRDQAGNQRYDQNQQNNAQNNSNNTQVAEKPELVVQGK